MNIYEKSPDTAVLVVSFGTSYSGSLEAAIGAVERAIARTCPGYEVRRAFTSHTIINILRERDGIEIDDVAEALKRAAADGMENLAVQPTHVMDGFEYRKLTEQLEEHRKLFQRITVGTPLLSSDQDFKAVARAITERTGFYDDGRTAMVFMGHGTEAEANCVYERMQNTLSAEGFDNYYIGTVEARPDVEDVAKVLRAKGIYKRVVLSPLMLVAGDHVNNDMAGDGEDSWKSIFGAEGYQVECVLEGLGGLEAIQDIYVAHALAAVEELGER